MTASTDKQTFIEEARGLVLAIRAAPEDPLPKAMLSDLFEEHAESILGRQGIVERTCLPLRQGKCILNSLDIMALYCANRAGLLLYPQALPEDQEEGLDGGIPIHAIPDTSDPNAPMQMPAPDPLRFHGARRWVTALLHQACQGRSWEYLLAPEDSGAPIQGKMDKDSRRYQVDPWVMRRLWSIVYDNRKAILMGSSLGPWAAETLLVVAEADRVQAERYRANQGGLTDETVLWLPRETVVEVCWGRPTSKAASGGSVPGHRYLIRTHAKGGRPGLESIFDLRHMSVNDRPRPSNWLGALPLGPWMPDSGPGSSPLTRARVVGMGERDLVTYLALHGGEGERKLAGLLPAASEAALEVAMLRKAEEAGRRAAEEVERRILRGYEAGGMDPGEPRGSVTGATTWAANAEGVMDTITSNLAPSYPAPADPNAHALVGASDGLEPPALQLGVCPACDGAGTLMAAWAKEAWVKAGRGKREVNERGHAIYFTPEGREIPFKTIGGLCPRCIGKGTVPGLGTGEDLENPGPDDPPPPPTEEPIPSSQEAGRGQDEQG
jgi:hypothetical protein